MNTLRTLLFALFFYPGTAGAVFLAFPAALVGREAVIRVTHGRARWHRWCAAWFLGVRSRVEGSPPRGGAIVAAKHQSKFETIEMLLLIERQAIVMKREIADITGWGWVGGRSGITPVVRKGGGAAVGRTSAGFGKRTAGR